MGAEAAVLEEEHVTSVGNHLPDYELLRILRRTKEDMRSANIVFSQFTRALSLPVYQVWLREITHEPFVGSIESTYYFGKRPEGFEDLDKGPGLLYGREPGELLMLSYSPKNVKFPLHLEFNGVFGTTGDLEEIARAIDFRDFKSSKSLHGLNADVIALEHDTRLSKDRVMPGDAPVVLVVSVFTYDGRQGFKEAAAIIDKAYAFTHSVH